MEPPHYSPASPAQPPYPPPRPEPWAPVPKRPGWLGQNLGCALGLGCFGMVLLGGISVAAIFGAVTLGIRASDPYSVAISTATHDPLLLAELGAPVEAGWFVTGSINVSGGSGHADIEIPVHGTARTGKIHAVASKSLGKWVFSTLSAEVDGRPAPMDLLHALPAP